MRRLLPLPLALVAAAVMSAPASGHELGATPAASPLPGVVPFAAGLFGSHTTVAPGEVLAPPSQTKVIDGSDKTTPASGPCTDAAKQSVPDGGAHDHLEIGQHRFACNLRELAFLSLRQELGARPDVILGEIDVKAGIAAVAVTYPEAGALFFDVKDPAKPRFLSWYRAGECEGAVIDVDCGAFIDLSSDAKTAFLSTQNTSVIPGSVPPVGTLPTTVPGVYTIDIADPRAPRLTDVYPVANAGGIHTARSHVIPGKGEFVFTNTLSAQGLPPARVDILRLERIAGIPRLRLVNSVEIDEIHDTFIQRDELDGRTYLYVAAGFASGFLVYDVTDPAAPVLKGEWDLTPQCAEDWYSHTIDVAVRNGRRFVTLPTELFNSAGPQSAEDQEAGCGKLAGNGDVAGPLWIVDATDFSKLGPASAVEADAEGPLAEASRRALVATWTNPAGRAGGNLTFSPHNQQIVGNRIYLSAYHAGIYVLDATEAFAGRSVRPVEVGLIVPSGAETRPIYEPNVAPQIPFFSTFPPVRSEIWDTYVYEGVVYAADMRGGFYAISAATTAEPAPASPAGRAARARGVVLRVRRTRGDRASCRRRGITAELKATGAARIKQVVFFAGSKRLGRVRKAPFRLRASRRTIGKARTIGARVTYADGATKRVTRRVPRCR